MMVETVAKAVIKAGGKKQKRLQQDETWQHRALALRETPLRLTSAQPPASYVTLFPHVSTGYNKSLL